MPGPQPLGREPSTHPLDPAESHLPRHHLRTWVSMSCITYLPIFLEGEGVPLERASLMLTGFLAFGRPPVFWRTPLGQAGEEERDHREHASLPIFASMMMVTKGPWLWSSSLPPAPPSWPPSR